MAWLTVRNLPWGVDVKIPIGAFSSILAVHELGPVGQVVRIWR